MGVKSKANNKLQSVVKLPGDGEGGVERKSEKKTSTPTSTKVKKNPLMKSGDSDLDEEETVKSKANNKLQSVVKLPSDGEGGVVLDEDSKIVVLQDDIDIRSSVIRVSNVLNSDFLRETMLPMASQQQQQEVDNGSARPSSGSNRRSKRGSRGGANRGKSNKN